jgi:hypothetical protein
MRPRLLCRLAALPVDEGRGLTSRRHIDLCRTQSARC